MTDNAFEKSVLWWERPSSWPKRDDAAGVQLQKIWLNHVGIVALIEARFLNEKAQQSLAAILRMVSDSARQVRRSGPLLGIVISKGAPLDDLKRDVLRLSRDQEWHRGDFVLRYIEGEQVGERYVAAEERAKEFMQTVLRAFEHIAPIAVDQGEQVYFRALKERLATEGIHEHAREVFDAVAVHQSEERTQRAIDALREEALDAIKRAAGPAKAAMSASPEEEIN